MFPPGQLITKSSSFSVRNSTSSPTRLKQPLKLNWHSQQHHQMFNGIILKIKVFFSKNGLGGVTKETDFKGVEVSMY